MNGSSLCSIWCVERKSIIGYASVFDSEIEFTCTDYCELLHVDCENALCEQTAKLSRGCHHQCVRPIHEIDVATRL
ncbi:hypothetical protein SASPL_110699 [Salvia splendens]|uniref:Uncharacterized protein n=1 Tax=Salvia splendens TaxID=180675 RepID=A0A8X9A3K8_SALSN|nr:hypothetical protein SASPL_110699 [Salvia splendens]